jgi:anti-sigma B factor antagonist
LNFRTEIELGERGAVRVARVHGELEISTVGALRNELLASVTNRDHGLVVDLSDTRYIDSAGVNVLFEVGESFADRQLGFAVVVPEGGLVERVFTIVGLTAVAQVHRTVDAAVAAIDDGFGPPRA